MAGGLRASRSVFRSALEILLALSLAAAIWTRSAPAAGASVFFLSLLLTRRRGRLDRWGIPVFFFAAFAAIGLFIEFDYVGIRLGLAGFLVATWVSLIDGRPVEPTASKGRILTLALWFALATCAIAQLWRAGRVWWLGPMRLLDVTDLFVFFPPELLWMSPLSHLMSYAILAAALIVVARLQPEWITTRTVVYTFGFFSLIGALEPILYFLDGPPLWALSALLAVRLTSEVCRGGSSFDRMTQWTTPILIAGAAVAIAAPAMGRLFRDAAVKEPEKDRPNVLVIVMDTVSRRHLSLYGHHHRTSPQVEELASKGVVFDRAFAPCSWTLPTHASLFTGRFPSQHRADFLTPLDATYPTLAEALSQRGYHTAGFVANSRNCGRHTGLARGFGHYEDFLSPWMEFICTSLLSKVIFNISTAGLDSAPNVNKRFLTWLDRKKSGPYFAFLNYIDAHRYPFAVPDPTFDQFSKLDPAERDRIRQTWMAFDELSRDPNLRDIEIELMRDTYDCEIAYLDHHLGLLFEALRQRSLLDNTLVVVTSDHGEHIGDHGGLIGHGHTLYRQLIDAPLVLCLPGVVPAGRRIDAPVTLLDVSATILDLTGVPNEKGFPGQSLSRHWDTSKFSSPAEPTPVLAELGKSVFMTNVPNSEGKVESIVHDGMHYIRYLGRDTEELFALDDADEALDLAKTEAGRARLPAMRQRLSAVVNSTARSRAGAPRELFAAAMPSLDGRYVGCPCCPPTKGEWFRAVGSR